MDDDEDWDAPSKVSSKSSQQNHKSTPHQTLKITDGYKYSYEALSSPANIDDWIETSSYGGSRRSSSGYSQSSFRDNNKSFRNDRSSSNKRFDSIKNDSFSNKNSPGNFNTSKSNQYHNRMQNAGTVRNDWDAPDNVNQMNGSWKGSANIPVNIATEEAWDAAVESMPQNHKIIQNSCEIPLFNPSNNVIDGEENWDATTGMSSKNEKTLLNENQSSVLDSSNVKDKLWNQMNESSTKKKSTSETEMYNLEHRTSNNSMDENWDGEASAESASNNSRTSFVKDIPLYNPNNSNGQSFSNDPFNQRYENNYHSNKHPHSRNFDSNDRFSRDSYSRHSRGNRHNPYERNTRGRGGRGSRGGRSGRDGSYQSFHSRDSSRNNGDRRESSYQHNSYTKNRNNDRTSSYQPPPVSYKNLAPESEEDWDSPSGFVEKRTDTNAPPSAIPPPVEVVEEESWD